MKKLFHSALTILLALAMLSTSVAAAVNYNAHDDYYKVITKDDYDLAPGVVESEIVLNNADGTHRQVAHVVEVDVNNEYTKVIPSYKGMIPTEGNYGVQVMSKQAEYAEANGYGNVVAAMNISLSWYTDSYYEEHPELVGEPLGYMILDGVKYENSRGKSSGAQTCAVINYDEKNGETRPADMPKVELRSTSDPITGWEEQVIPANFGFLVKDGVNQYSKDNNASNGASRSFLGIKEDGTFVMVMNDGRQSPYSIGFTSYEMAEFMLSLGCVQAVNGDGGGSSSFLSQRPGEELKINCSPSDGAERETTHGVLVISTAPATGEFVRANISSEYDYYTPNSTVKFSAVGTDLVGTAAKIPDSAKWQLKDSSFGTIENGVFTSTGKEGEVTVQMVYEGKVVGEDTINIVMPDKISFAQNNMTIPYGKTVEIAINASYDSKTVCIKASDVKFELSNSNLGTMNGFNFTAAMEGTVVEPGEIEAQIGELKITAKLSLGKGSKIVYDFENKNLDGWNIVSNYPQYGPMGSAKDSSGNYYYNGQNELGKIKIVDSSNGKVRNGKYALAVDCDFTQTYETGYLALNLNFPVIDTTDALKVGFWLYVPYDARHAEIRIVNVDTKKDAGGIDNGGLFDYCEGWHYITVEAPTLDNWARIKISVDDRASGNNGAYYDYITEPNLNGKYTLYIDDITIDYSTAVDDRENPVFETPNVLSSTGDVAELKGQTINYNKPTFEVKVADYAANNATGIDSSSAAVYVDGKKVESQYSNGKLSVADVYLADGVHTVKFEISDNAGNSSWVGGSVNVQTGNDTSVVKVVPKDPKADRLLVGSLYWLDVVASDVETIKKVDMTFDLNNASSWELEGMTTAEGFTAEWDIQKDDNIATVTIKRTGENKQTGEAVIASIPVRTWESHITEYEGYEDQTPAKLVSRGIIWAQSIEVALEKGVITYVDSYSDKTTGTFGMKNILVDTELFFTNYSRASVQGAQSWKDEKIKEGIGFHEHKTIDMEDKEATCTECGYIGRTFCETCNSVVKWGTVKAALGHSWAINGEGKLACVNGGELFTGVYTDGKEYVDGVVASDGWVDNTYYYVNGAKVTGQYFINGVMCTFDKDGVYDPDYKYTGFYTTTDGKVMYFVGNKYVTGYQYLIGKPYFFDENGYGFEGDYILCGEKCKFEDGHFVSCSTANVLNAGMAGPKAEYVIYADGTFKLGGSGETYSFTNHGTRPFIGYNYKIRTLIVGKDITRIGGYFFSYSSINNIKFEENSKLTQIGTAAFYEDTWGLNTIELPEGVTYISNIAFGKCTSLTKVVVPKSVTSINKAAFKNSDNVTLYVPEESYALQYAVDNGISYKITENKTPEAPTIPEAAGDIVNENGTRYYHLNGRRNYAGLIYKDGALYYVRSNGQLAVNATYWVTKTNDIIDAGNYTFGADGKMLNPPITLPSVDEPEAPTIPEAAGDIVNENGTLYYHLNGRRNYAGLIYKDGALYYVRSNGQLAVNTTYWVTKTNDIIDAGNYTFGADGKMLNPPITLPSVDEPETPTIPEAAGDIVNENGTLYYYLNGRRNYAGLIYKGGEFYYVRSNGQLAVNTTYWVTKTNDLLKAGNYTFAADGKMITN